MTAVGLAECLKTPESKKSAVLLGFLRLNHVKPLIILDKKTVLHSRGDLIETLVIDIIA